MKAGDLMTLLPLLIVSGTVVMVMLVIAFARNHKLVTVLSFLGLAAAFGGLVAGWNAAADSVTPLLVMDSYSRLFMGLILLATLAVMLLSHAYLARLAGRREEYYLLLLLATLGSMVLAASNHFASFFLGLELLSVSLYGLIAYRRGHGPGIEAGMKYLVLAGVSSAFLLFGMALVYARLGTMEFSAISTQLLGIEMSGFLLPVALGLMVVGIGFKLALVPFHLWTPDVFQGAPAPVSAYVATVSKGAMFALLLRYFAGLNLPAHRPLTICFVVIAIASMFTGNLLALFQNNLKRLLAYSSIAHLGYLLVAFMANGALGVEAVIFYLTAYFVTTLAAFGVVTVLSNEAGRTGDCDALEDYRGLAWRRPWLAGIFSAALLSLAGIPLTAGFIGKFYLLATGVGSGMWLLVVVLVTTSVIGVFYYLRVLITMYQPQPADIPLAGHRPGHSGSVLPPDAAGSLTLALLAAAIVWLGVYPMPVMNLIQSAVARWI